MLDKFLDYIFGRGKQVVEFGLIPPISFLIAWAYFGNPYVATLVPIGQVALLLYERHADSREYGRLESQSFSAGSLSKHLAPKLRQILEGSAVLYVTENDSAALLSWRAAVWRHFLKEALKRGSTVNYILTDANEADKRKLAQLKNELESGTDGTIQFCFFTRQLPDGDEDRKLRDSLRTFHPVIVEDSTQQRVMWIEGYHPIGNEEWAYHVEFLMPEDAAKDKRYDEYKKLLDRVIGKYTVGNEAHA